MKERIINRMVGTTLVVSVSGTGRKARVRIIEGAEGPLKAISPNDFFIPGWLCRLDEPRNARFLKAVQP
jgi:hypothetical protein